MIHADWSENCFLSDCFRFSHVTVIYGGYSAGSMVTTRNLRYYGHDYLVPEAVPEIYNTEAVTDGLGLIDEYLIAHCDVEGHAPITKMYKERIEAAGAKMAAAVSGNTDYLVIADPASTSSKAVKARKLGTKLISYQEAAAMLQ